MSRLVDELLIARKVSNTLYAELNSYRKKRNNVIHNLLVYNQKKLAFELKKVYESGKKMKVLIIDDLRKEFIPGLALAEIEGQLDELGRELRGYNPGSRAHTSVQADIHSLLLKIMDISDRL